MRLKIFSYNIQGLPYLPDSWTEPIALWLTGTDYDFICFQEVFTVGRFDMLKKRLELEGYLVYKPNDFIRSNILGSGLVTAIKKSRFSVLEEGFIQFKESIGAENLANKGLQWLKVSDSICGEQIMVINTHMQADHPFNYFVGCTDTKPTRRSQVVQLLEFLGSYPKMKHLVIGDLNADFEAHEDLLYLTGLRQGIRKHTYESTGEDLDHVAIVPKLCGGNPVIHNVSVLDRVWWSDHWPIHVILSI